VTIHYYAIPIRGPFSVAKKLALLQCDDENLSRKCAVASQLVRAVFQI
jgi:hypothetical protein